MIEVPEITRLQELAYELRIEGVMTKDVVTVTPQTSMVDLREILRKHRISGTPVLENGELVGIISIEDLIKALGAKAGVTLNPATSLSTLEEILPDVDLVLVMSVNPGFGSQTYIPGSTAKIARLRQMLDERGLTKVELEVDGGIKADNAAKVVAAGATVLVAGSAIFNRQASIAANVAALRQGAEPTCASI